jgi:hypothetical protein
MRLGTGAHPLATAALLEMPAHHRQAKKDREHTDNQDPALHAHAPNDSRHQDTAARPIQKVIFAVLEPLP